MLGETISHYTILEELGRGGMGVVYRAEDTRLQRHVAIKVLPAHQMTDDEARTRFIREARAASTLEHPSICHIYEIDETPDGRIFMVMPCYEGETLEERLRRGPLEIGEALDISAQIASALSVAHGKGIIHRDIKPANVMLTGDGTQVKLMDFGLARRLDETKLTRTGTTLGTLAYMSPEQAMGKESDRRTDIWSLGVMMYEMLTGLQPFHAEYEPGVLYAILNEDPEAVSGIRPDISDGIEVVVEKALVKDPDSRYRSVDEILGELEKQQDLLEMGVRRRRLLRMRRQARMKLLKYGLPTAMAAAALVVLFIVRPFDISIDSSSKMSIAQENSMAVLGFENVADPADEGREAVSARYLLTAALEESEYIRVLSEQRQHDIIKELSGTPGDLLDTGASSEIARKGDINWIVRGKILSMEPGILLTSEITDAVTGETRCTQRAHGSPGEELFEVVDRLAAEIRSDFLIPAGDAPERPVAEITTKSLESYKHYITGIEQYYEYSWDRAVASFEKALEYDSTFVQARFRRALAKMTLGSPVSVEEWSRISKSKDRAPYLERRLIEIVAGEEVDVPGLERLAKDFPDEKELHYWLGIVYFHRMRDVDRSIEQFEMAIDLDPDYTMALMEITAPYLESGRFEDALWAVNQSKRLTPQNPLPYYSSGLTYGLMGNIDKAMEGFEKALELDPSFAFAKESLGVLSVIKGDYAAAEDFFQGLEASPDDHIRALGRNYMAYIPMYRGKLDSALDVLERGIVEDRKTGMTGKATADKHMLRAVIFREKGDLEVAMREMERSDSLIQEVHRGDLEVTELHNRHFLVQLIAERGDLQLAREKADSLGRFLERFGLRDGVPSYWYAEGVLKNCEGDIEASIEALKKAASIDWTNKFWSHYALGEVQLSAGMPGEAAAVLEKSAAMCGTHSFTNPILAAKAHYLAGKAYEEMGKQEEARAKYEKFIELWKDADPYLEEVDDARNRILHLGAG
jgi:serine/threonine protein kinase/lipoprotein NlpI